MTRLLLTLPLLVSLPMGSAAQNAKAPKVTVVGLHVEKPSSPRPQDNAFNGTAIELLVDGQDYSPVACDVKASKVTSATDDNGLDLTVDPQGSKGIPRNFFSGFGQEYWQGPYLTVKVRLPNWPGPGAGKIHLKGSLVLLCGDREMTAEAKNVPLEEGKKTTVGPATVGLQIQGAKDTTVNVKSTQPLKSVQFLNADGKELAAAGSIRHSAGFGSKAVESYLGIFHLDGQVERCTVRLTYFQATKQLKVPVNLEFGLGL
jgi:hypothetical protein